jgi:hypothetical protein
VPASHRHRALPAAGTVRPHGRHRVLILAPPASGLAPPASGLAPPASGLILPASGLILPASWPGTLAAIRAAEGRILLAQLQRFLLAYSGVFALIALTAAVAAGLIATDRLVITPAGRVISQAVHRALALAAVGFLASHVLLEVLAHRSRAIDAIVPFLGSQRTLYLGLGTLACDLVLLIAVTGIARGKFATHWTATWRAVHVTAYLGWPLAILHGLLGGRPAKPYVDWSYGACVAAVALALVIRLVATTRSRAEVVPHPVPGHAAPVLPAALLTARRPSARLSIQPPAHRVLPGDIGQAPMQYGIVDDGMPRSLEAP